MDSLYPTIEVLRHLKRSLSKLKAISNSVKNHPVDFTRNPDFTNNNFTETEVQDSWTDNNISDDNDDDDDLDLEDIFTMSTSESSNPDEEAQDDYDTESLYSDALSRKASLVIWPLEKNKQE